MPPDRYHEFVLDLASSLLLADDVMPPRAAQTWRYAVWRRYIVARCWAEQ